MSTGPFVYNPDQKSREQLIAEFVIRREIFEELFAELREAARDIPPQHFLLAAQRGMGKTTLLLRLKYAVEDDAKLRKYLLPVRFSEEQYNIGRLERLWEETAQLLAHQSAVYEGLYDTMLIHEDQDDYERICFDLLEARLKKEKQRALLMIDNIGDLFDKFPEIQNHRLRQLLMSSPHIQLIGASARVLEHTFRYDKPFFEFFREIKLNPLNEEACHTLLRALGKSYGETKKIEHIIRTHPGRIDALRQITGGVPRTMVLLYQIFVDNENGTAFDDLQQLLDSVNSLYKHRMDELKPQQQQLMDALARAWDAITAAEVLKLSKLYREGLQSNQVSAQLKQLADNQIVEVIEGPGRSKNYRIRERFFNIWYLMRHGKKQNCEQVLWLIRFFETWYSTKDLKTVLEKQRETMRSGAYSYHAAYLRTMALLGSGQVAEEDKNVLKEETVEYLLKKGKSTLARDIGAIGKKADVYTRLAKEAIAKDDLKEAETNFLKAIKAQEKDALRNTALFYVNEMYQPAKAESFLLKMLEEGNEPDIYKLLGSWYFSYGNLDKAEYYLLKSSEVENEPVYGILGAVYLEKGDTERAEKYLLDGLQQKDNLAVFQMGRLYRINKKNNEEALKYFMQALPLLDLAALEIARIYEESDNIIKAEAYYRYAYERNVPGAAYFLGVFYFNRLDDYSNAEKYFTEVVSSPDVTSGVYAYLVVIGLLQSDVKKIMHWAEKLFSRHLDEIDPDILLWLCMRLLRVHQYNFLLEQFRAPNGILLQKAKPVYYALAYFMPEELPGVYEKTSPEIAEAVEDIIRAVKEAHEKQDKQEK